MGKLERPGEIRVHRFNGCAECDVVVIFRGREMVLKLPDYSQALTWAQMEAKSYGITAEVSEEPDRAAFASGVLKSDRR
jgi:hypothetical protein